jgi:CxxC motif-containing protein
MAELLCIVCPMGCQLTVNKAEDGSYRVSGATCKRGTEYGAREAVAPRRMLTTTLATAWRQPLPVRSAAPIDRSLMLSIQKRLAGLTIDRPVAKGDIVVADIDGQGTSLIAAADSARA